MSACPKCTFELETGALECPACGIVIAKYLALGTGPIPTVTVSPPAPPPTASLPASPRLSEPPASPVSPPPVGNPYAPPVAVLEGPPASFGGTVPVVDGITRLTLDSLQKARPWMAFLSIYGLVMVGFIVLFSIVMAVVMPTARGEGAAFALFYLLYGLVVFACILPLRRSALALKKIATSGASASLEKFAVEQATFWRRVGIIAAVGVVLIVLVSLAGVLIGIAAAMKA